MKSLQNGNEARCKRCDYTYAKVNEFGNVVCSLCGSPLLTDLYGRIFKPEFENKMFCRNKYTPKVVCRRKNNRPWPVSKERRNHARL